MSFNFFKKFLPTKSYLGVDIGTTSIKLIELAQTQGLPKLISYGFLETYGHLERLNNAIQTSSMKMLDNETVNLIEVLLKNSDVKSKNVVVSLPTFSAFVTLIEVPVMNTEDTTKAMIFQAKQYIPLPISSVTLDWVKVGERKLNGADVQQILLVSVPNDNIQKYKNIFREAGLNLVAIELEGFATSRVLTAGDNRVSLIIDIGSRSTTIAIAKNGYMKFTGQTDFAGASLTQTIASGLNIRVRRAEDLKKMRGLKGTGGEYELSTLMLPMLDVIISEAKRTKNNFESGYGEKVERVIISGGGANLIGVVPYFQEQFGLPTEKANPFGQISYPSELEPFVSELASEFTVAIGLGMKPLKLK